MPASRPDYEAIVKLAAELRSFIEEVFGGPPNGRCDIASLLASRVLNDTFGGTTWKTKAGYFYRIPQTRPRTGSWHSNWHCWSSDGTWIVDLTADQFGSDFPGVVVVPVDDRHYHAPEFYGDEIADPNYYSRWLTRQEQRQPTLSPGA